MVTGPKVGLLALQGDFALHAGSLKRLGAEPVEVRSAGELQTLDRLILPGGESSTMLKLMEGTGIFESILELHKRGGAIFGTCAGLILMAKEVQGPHQQALGILDVDITRNAYGRQQESFETDLAWADEPEPMRAVYIRAPRITRIGPGVETLISHQGEPMVVRQDRLLAASFHPEMTPDTRLHEYFLSMQPGELCAAR